MKKCIYCEFNDRSIKELDSFQFESLRIVKIDDEYYLSGGMTQRKINYCPICGRKLSN